VLAHLEALEASLEPLGYPVHRIYAPDDALNELPYLILEAAAWGDTIDMPVCGESDSLHDRVRVKAVGTNTDAVMKTLRRVRVLWSPSRSWTTVPMAGRVLQVKFRRSEFVDVDRDVTLPSSNRHPGIGVDTYTIDSQPGGTP
jgi:hypothetical protein